MANTGRTSCIITLQSTACAPDFGVEPGDADPLPFAGASPETLAQIKLLPYTPARSARSLSTDRVLFC